MSSAQLIAAARQLGTPLYVYDPELAKARIATLRTLFSDRFAVSYAIKSNPNLGLLSALCPVLDSFDASSWAEVERALAAGMPAARISFSGPAKRRFELERAVAVAVGELVVESLDEAKQVSELATASGRVQALLVRINPSQIPRKFGASMAGGASQFGIDEEDIAEQLPQLMTLPGVELIGFHCYSGTNCLDAASVAENFAIFARLFRLAQQVSGITPRKLIFGSGFGITYLPDEVALDVEALPSLVNPVVDALLAEPAFASARCSLEMGRWLIGPAGWLLTEVIAAKCSRGREIRACDAGFNNHLAACGMMGSVFRRNWVYQNLTNPDAALQTYTLVGPLCTTIDRLAMDLELPETRIGDIIAIPHSGAYGLTASPTRFISHPEPREALLLHGGVVDVTESLHNHPGSIHSSGVRS